ncbi:hypothetical protein [Actinocatenispora rupis]|uniref:Uncharacterized protein n=1 Tax=Actinocatenispora rupis TaxID=519421 RepID=A0A8J3NGE0_9ACTN|nr:hypothetical protein [Actinocatenispora rupis]GID16327.1 hypothetical protein Aru02nite_72160 [Actinocatenispora rupis]
MSKATMEQPQTDERVALDPMAQEDEPVRRRRGRRLLFVGMAGVLLVGAAWTFATVRSGLASAREERRNSKRRNRFRRH